MTKTITIHERFCGPAQIGNGGYVCGLLAQEIGGAAEVTLHRPAPLERTLSLSQAADGQVALHANGHLIAEARPARLELVVPLPPSYAEVEAASRRYGSLGEHPFPTCFVCGPQRVEGDGLRIFPGPMPEGNLFAASWVPDASLAGDAGQVRPEFLWAALDCPGGVAAAAHDPRPILLGQLTARIDRPVRPNQRYVVIGWPISRNGRKHLAGTAVFNESGLLCAHARAVWIEPKQWAAAGSQLPEGAHAVVGTAGPGAHPQ